MSRAPVWLAVLLSAGTALAQTESPPPKEVFTYNIEWRLINAGKAVIEWHPSEVEGHPGWQAHLDLESIGLVSKLYKVDMESVSNVDRDFCAVSTLTTGREGSRRRETQVAFDNESHKAFYRERDLVKNTLLTSQQVPIPPCVHDVLGGLFYLRGLDLEPGKSVEIPVSDGKKSAMVKVEAQQGEEVKVPDGTFKTVRYEINLFNNVLYRRPAHLYVWFSDDNRKLPVQIRVRLQIAIGTITLQLASHE
ncbi:MAG TPA: DUF3108 domain-containing protein [Bryobacteraceae bacterium]|nr:DUF3108 domain-containing protein [Bryobacteraceae bacterium]